MSKVIKMGLSTSSIRDAISELKAFKASLEVKKNKLLERLGEIGAQEASVRFTSAMYDGVNDSHVSLKTTNNGYAIVASGHAVAFIEFGAGVYYNPIGPYYPQAKPEGIVGIGEYGDGKGKRHTWYYNGEPGTNGEVQENGAVKTHGNPAAMPMWYASEEMRSKIEKIAKEVFG
ncbi:MAG: hypothetical protein IKW20_05925 [Bacteroidales bacterium]|nr:hypothetical protein [Bacteroidales bacterium]